MNIDTCTALLHKINKYIVEINKSGSVQPHSYTSLLDTINEISIFSEDRILARIDKIYKFLNGSSQISTINLRIYSGKECTENLLGLIGKNVIKPVVEDVHLFIERKYDNFLSEVPFFLLNWSDEPIHINNYNKNLCLRLSISLKMY